MSAVHFGPGDLSYLIGRKILRLLRVHGDYSANPRASNAALAVRASKMNLIESSLATLKGNDLNRILSGMGVNQRPKASRTYLAATIFRHLNKRMKAQGPAVVKEAPKKKKAVAAPAPAEPVEAKRKAEASPAASPSKKARISM
jgi:hypothetical protein